MRVMSSTGVHGGHNTQTFTGMTLLHAYTNTKHIFDTLRWIAKFLRYFDLTDTQVWGTYEI